MENCIFCKIVRGEIPSSKVYEDEMVYAFRDINPQAPVHVLVLPKKHMVNVLECDGETMQALLKAIQIIAKQEGVAEDGFRIVSNCGKNGAQSVNHLHIHLMGGRQLADSMA
jgi:histidine triad (HIT) family protein